VRGEIVLGVPHCLLSQAPDLASVERVYSHPQALAQCRSWLEKNLAKAELVPSASTAAAVEDSLAHESSAAIASPLAAEIYGIGVLRKGIQDHPDNRTRFLLLAAS